MYFNFLYKNMRYIQLYTYIPDTHIHYKNIHALIHQKLSKQCNYSDIICKHNAYIDRLYVL